MHCSASLFMLSFPSYYIWISIEYENTVCDTESLTGYTSTREGKYFATLSVLFSQEPKIEVLKKTKQIKTMLNSDLDYFEYFCLKIKHEKKCKYNTGRGAIS